MCEEQLSIVLADTLRRPPSNFEEPMLRIYTAQIGRYHGANALDITIKSAPPEGARSPPIGGTWCSAPSVGRLSVLCYCTAAMPFCHRHILARDILPVLGARYCGEH